MLWTIFAILLILWALRLQLPCSRGIDSLAARHSAGGAGHQPDKWAARIKRVRAA